MFKTVLILLIISSILIPVAVSAGGVEVHSEPGACPGDPEGGELSPVKTPDELTPAVKTIFIFLPVPSSSWFVCNPVLIPIVVRQDVYSKPADLQISYVNHR